MANIGVERNIILKWILNNNSKCVDWFQLAQDGISDRRL
jgi:hypothetical protein